MQAVSVSAQELSFINQHGRTIDSVATDLANLYQQIQNTYYNLLSAEDSIISRLRPLVNYTRDVEYFLRALSHQTLDFEYYRLPGLITVIGGDSVPVLLTPIERTQYDGTLASLNYQPNEYRLVDAQDAVRALSSPLAKFLAFRSTQTVMMSSAPNVVVPNVEVSNNASGWLIVYCPTFMKTELGFGGPSSPVSGYLPPATYVFGIKKTGPAQWEQVKTPWRIPQQPKPYLPLP
jgi:hypothetical protein